MSANKGRMHRNKQRQDYSIVSSAHASRVGGNVIYRGRFDGQPARTLPPSPTGRLAGLSPAGFRPPPRRLSAGLGRLEVGSGGLRGGRLDRLRAGLGLAPARVRPEGAIITLQPMARRSYHSDLPPPFLKRLSFLEERVKADEFPFTIPAFQRGKLQLDFERPITIIVGENGTGKSTLLEGIAGQCGFNLSGGNRNHAYANDQNAAPFSHAIRLSWFPKVTRGFFMRAESFYNFGRYLDEMQKEDPVTLQPYGGKSLHEQSHGESFLALFTNKFHGQAIYYHHLVLQGTKQYPAPTEDDVVQRTHTTYSGPLVLSEDLMSFNVEKAGVMVVPPKK